MKVKFALVMAGLMTFPVMSAEFKIGDSTEKYGMEVGAVYLQAVKMEPEVMGEPPMTDIHLEADIHALKNNPHGFPEGAWIPYLGVSYELKKTGTDWSLKGEFVPMTASDGPHYGVNLKLNGPGKYQVRYFIEPPSHHGFHRHVDRETQVAPWWEPFEVEWEFTYLGTGKKGGY